MSKTGAKTMEKPKGTAATKPKEKEKTEVDKAGEDLQREGYWDADGKGTGVLEHIDPKTLADSPLNYRQTFSQADIDDIASTAKDVGILQALRARPTGKDGKGRELVLGHKRKRGAIKAKLKTVPVLVKPMSDKDVRLCQMIENTKRGDVHPLEEADGFKALMTEEKMSVADIAAALARSTAAVYRRLALTHLCKAGRTAFFKGDMRAGVAELIARLSDQAAQTKAVKDLAGESHDGGLVSVKAAKRHIERDYLRQLKDAPFSPKDAELLPSAGACSACPKRTGSNADLFGDLDGKNVCTDGVCFEEKSRATWKAKAKAHKAKGGTVLSKKADVAKAFPYKRSSSLAYDCGYSDLDASRYHGEPTSAAALKKAKAELPPIVLVRDPSGGIRRLVKTIDLNTAMKKIGGGGKQTSHGVTTGRVRSPAEKKADDRREREADIKRRVGRAALASLADKIVKVPSFDSVGFWHVLAILAIEGAWHDTCKATCSRRGIVVPKGGSHSEELLKHAKAIGDGKVSPDTSKATSCELLAALVVEVMLKASDSMDTDKWKAVKSFMRIDPKRLEKKAREERGVEDRAKRAEEKAKAARKKAKATKATKKATKKKTKRKAPAKKTKKKVRKPRKKASK